MDIYQEHEQQDEISHEAEEDEFSDVLREDKHIGEFDNVPDNDEDQEEGYDSDIPLLKCRHTAHCVDSNLQSKYPKATQIRERVEGKHPQIADYEADAQQILMPAIHIFKSLVSMENTYPDKLTELVWAKQAWWEAAEDLDIQLAPNRKCVKIVSSLRSDRHMLILLFIRSRPIHGTCRAR